MIEKENINLSKLFLIDYNKDVLTILFNICDNKEFETNFKTFLDITSEDFYKIKNVKGFEPMAKTSKEIWKKIQNPDSKIFQYICSLDIEIINDFLEKIKKIYFLSKIQFCLNVNWGSVNIVYSPCGTIDLKNKLLKNRDICCFVDKLEEKNLYPRIINLSHNLLTPECIHVLGTIYWQEDIECINLMGNKIDLDEFVKHIDIYCSQFKKLIYDKTIIIPKNIYESHKTEKPYCFFHGPKRTKYDELI